MTSEPGPPGGDELTVELMILETRVLSRTEMRVHRHRLEIPRRVFDQIPQEIRDAENDGDTLGEYIRLQRPDPVALVALHVDDPMTIMDDPTAFADGGWNATVNESDPLREPGAQIPTGEQLGRQAERYLAEQGRDTDR